MTQETSKAKSCLMGCGIVALLPIVLLVLAGVIFTVNNRPPKIAIPSHSVPKDNGWDNFVRASEMLATIRHFGPLSDSNGPNSWDMPKYEAFMKANASILVEFRKGLPRPCVNPPLRGSRSRENMARLRELARTLRSEGLYHEKKHEYGAAVESQLDCIELGVSLPNKGDILTDLVGRAIVAIGSSKIEDNLPKLNAMELARAAEHLERIQKDAVPYSDVMLEDSLVTASEFMDGFSKPDNRQSMLNPSCWVRNASWFASKSGNTFGDFLLGAKLAFINKTAMINSYLAYARARSFEARKPFMGKSSVPVPNNIPTVFGDVELRAWQAHLDYEAKICLIQTEIALLRYNADNGRYPDKLDLLVPKYLKSVPIDPFGIGKPLRYMALKAGKSFKLYSLGFDLVDQGGKPHPKYDRSTGDMLLGQEDN